MISPNLFRFLGIDVHMLMVLLACCLVSGHGLEPRRLFELRLLGTISMVYLWTCGCNLLWVPLPNPIWNAGGIAVFKYLGIYLLTVIAFHFCTHCNWTTAIYGGTTGYILQHCAERTNEVIHVIFPTRPVWGDTMILTGTTALVCLCFVLMLRSRYDILEYDCYGGELDILLITAVATVGSVIVLEPMIRLEFEIGREGITVINSLTLIYIDIMSVLLSLLALVISMCQMRQAESKKKAQIAEQLLHAERGRYTLEKETVEAINIRCHDIKHQIAALGEVARQKELRELEKLINIYDCGLKTECAALDLVLSNKSLVCSGKQIELTCVADGRQLCFMEDADVYALFGNILDNAIEAVERLSDWEKRLISLTVRAQNHFLFIGQENYYAGTLIMEQGLPVTTKTNKRFHGFGMQSIKMLTEKYGGDLQIQTNGGIYRLSIMLPIAEKEYIEKAE